MNEHRKPGRPPKPREELEEDRAHQELDDLFEDAQGVVTVKVERLSPAWAAGHVGIFKIGVGKTISMEEIRHRFGGRDFQLIARDSTGKIIRRKNIAIDDVPRREYKEIFPDGTHGSKQEDKTDRFRDIERLLRMNLSPEIFMMVAPSFGLPISPYQMYPQAQHQTQSHTDDPNNPLQVMQIKLMFDLMNQVMMQSMEMSKQMLQQRQAMEESFKPKEPLMEVKKLFSLMQEMNSAASGMTSGADNPAVDVIKALIPSLQGVAESFIKMRAVETTRNNTLPVSIPPVLTPRKDRADDVDMFDTAREMGRRARGLDQDTQEQLLAAFLQGRESNIEENNSSDIIEEDTYIDDPDDLDLLNATNDNKIDAKNIPDGEHSRTVAAYAEVDHERDQ